MTISRVHFLQRLTTTHLRKEEDHADDNDSVSSASSTYSSSDEEEFANANESSDLPTFFLGVPILREERKRHSREESSQSRGNGIEQGETAASPRAPDDGHAETSTNTPQNQNDDAPLSPWKNSTAKRDIIKELNDDTSDIHLFIGSYGPGDWKQVKFEQLRLKYARRYQKSNFKENMKRLLLHLQNNTGVFGAKKDKEWYTSQNNVSDG